jgi:hypothetical protein
LRWAGVLRGGGAGVLGLGGLLLGGYLLGEECLLGLHHGEQPGLLLQLGLHGGLHLEHCRLQLVEQLLLPRRLACRLPRRLLSCLLGILHPRHGASWTFRVDDLFDPALRQRLQIRSVHPLPPDGQADRRIHLLHVPRRLCVRGLERLRAASDVPPALESAHRIQRAPGVRPGPPDARGDFLVALPGDIAEPLRVEPGGDVRLGELLEVGLGQVGAADALADGRVHPLRVARGLGVGGLECLGAGPARAVVAARLPPAGNAVGHAGDPAWFRRSRGHQRS